MIAGRLATVSALLTMAVLMACAQDLPNSAPPAVVEPTATTGLAGAPPTLEPTAVPTFTPADTPSPARAASPTATAAPTPVPTIAPPGLLRLADNLDDPQGYCVDVAGFGSNLLLDAPLQAHTCKPGSDDQLFSLGDSDGRGFRLAEHDRCLAAAMTEPGAEVFVTRCESGMVGQRFIINGEGRVYLEPEAGPVLCLGVAAGSGEPAGGRNHLRRDLSLFDCAEAGPALITWEMVNP